MKEQCSELFSEIFDSGCGGCLRTCACGIIHFDSDWDWDWEENELEELQEKASKNPEKYKVHDCAVGTISIDNVEIVYGCSCDIAMKYENFITAHAVQIAKYLNGRSKKLMEYAKKLEAIIEDKEVERG